MPAMPAMSTMPVVSPKLGLLIWLTVSSIIIIILLILLLIYAYSIYNNTSYNEAYLMQKQRIKDGIVVGLSNQYHTNKGENISDNSYTASNGKTYYGPKSANSTIGTGATIQSYAQPSN